MKLYACPGTCSLAPHILLQEFGVPHEIEWLDLSKGDSRTPEFLEINPVGQVPTLVTDEGEVVTEVSAISLYLFERYGKSDTPVHQTVRHLSFIATELHKSFYPIFHGSKMVSDENAVTQLAEFFKNKLSRNWKYVDQLLPADDDLDGQEIGPADPYLYTVCRWWLRTGGDFDEHPFLRSFLANMEARPSVKAALAVEGLEPIVAEPTTAPEK